MAWTERYVRADAAGSGDGTTDTNSGGTGAFTLAEAITHSASNTGQRYNVKAGTYANTTTGRTFAGVGLTTAPNWWRGFKTTIADMDAAATSHGTFASGSEIPVFTFTTGKMTVSGAHQIFSNIDIQGAATTGMLSATAANNKFHRVRAENTNAAAGSVAADVSAAANFYTLCWFKATATATRVFNITAGSGIFHHCVFAGGGNGVDCATTAIVVSCIFRDNGGHGLRALTGTGTFFAVGNTFYSPGSACIRLDVVPTTPFFADNIFAEYGTYGIDNNSGANTNIPSRMGNVYYNSAGSGTALNFGDSPAFETITETGDHFSSAATGNFALDSTAAGRAVAIPFANLATTSYADKGAAQHQDAGVGGTTITNPLPAVRSNSYTFVG